KTPILGTAIIHRHAGRIRTGSPVVAIGITAWRLRTGGGRRLLTTLRLLLLASLFLARLFLPALFRRCFLLLLTFSRFSRLFLLSLSGFRLRLGLASLGFHCLANGAILQRFVSPIHANRQAPNKAIPFLLGCFRPHMIRQLRDGLGVARKAVETDG